jgi:hypothetical protein
MLINLLEKYRQTGYFVASKWNIKFLNEWIWMCNPEVKQNPQLYAPIKEVPLNVCGNIIYKWDFLFIC